MLAGTHKNPFTSSRVKYMLAALCFFSACISIGFSQSNMQHSPVDSLIRKIDAENTDTAKIHLYINLFIYVLNNDPSVGLPYRQEALKLAEKQTWLEGSAILYTLIGRDNWITGNFDMALKNHFSALAIYRQLNDKKKQAEVIQYIGQDYADQGNYSEALKYFQQALDRYQELGDQKSVASCYLFFSFVYGTVGNISEAAKANYQAMKIFETIGDNYSLAVSTSNLADLYVRLGRKDEALIYYQKCVEVLKKANDYINLAGLYVSIGDLNLEKGHTDLAKSNYTDALETAKSIHNPTSMGQVYCSIADMYKKQGDLNACLENYLAAENLFRSVSNYQRIAFVCSEIGKLYLIMHDLPKATVYFDKSAALIDSVPSIPVLKQYYEGVQLLDSAGGNWKQAYLNYKTFIFYRDSLNNAENTKSSMQTVMQYEFDKKEAAAKAEQEKKDIQQRNIRNYISAGLAGSLIFLVVVYRQRNKISKARKRSNELLLNILPSEVADELMDKGSADAKQFEEVTVMFTDFKGFTKISEKLSPNELVNEIDTCFKAFDHIIGKYHIEKIKTIGDSYMCAGGLPVVNHTHAKDVVMAAMEIRQFMAEHAEIRKKENREVFEIRIGIHTGPVVAGIVGVKKFAYDIWGDTVNIAARMEQNSEAGKINVSGYTYELIKDSFDCKYRGRIDAKNKGEIDMYFVETAS